MTTSNTTDACLNASLTTPGSPLKYQLRRKTNAQLISHVLDAIILPMNKYKDYGIVTIIYNNGKLLLTKETRSEFLDLWAPPHGICEQIDGNEKECVIREVREKTGLRVVPVKRLHSQPADSKVKTIYFWKAECDVQKVVLDKKSSEYGWFTVSEALKLDLYPGTEKFLRKIESGHLSLE